MGRRQKIFKNKQIKSGFIHLAGLAYRPGCTEGMKYPPGENQAEIIFINVFIGDEMRPPEEVQPEAAQGKAQRRGESVSGL